jgi:hypothetical protein
MTPVLGVINKELDELEANPAGVVVSAYIPQQWYRDSLEVLQDQVEDLVKAGKEHKHKVIAFLTQLCDEKIDPRTLSQARAECRKYLEVLHADCIG